MLVEELAFGVAVDTDRGVETYYFSSPIQILAVPKCLQDGGAHHNNLLSACVI